MTTQSPFYNEYKDVVETDPDFEVVEDVSVLVVEVDGARLYPGVVRVPRIVRVAFVNLKQRTNRPYKSEREDE